MTLKGYTTMSDTLVSTTTVAIGDLVHPLSSTPDELATHYRDQIGRVVEISSTVNDGMPYYVGIKFDGRFPEDEARRIGVAHSDQYVFTGWSAITPKVGDKVRATHCQPGASPEWWAVANGRTGVVTSIDGEAVTMRFDTPFTVDTEQWTAARVSTVAVIEQAEVSDTESNPIGLVVPSIAERERTASRLYDTLVEAVNDMAEREEWCSSFEAWAENLPYDTPFEVRRTQDVEYSVDIDLTYEISRDTLANHLSNEFGGDHDNIEDSLSVVSSVTITMTLSGEDPNDCESYTVREYLRDAGYSGYDDYDITNFETI